MESNFESHCSKEIQDNIKLVLFCGNAGKDIVKSTPAALPYLTRARMHINKVLTFNGKPFILSGKQKKHLHRFG